MFKIINIYCDIYSKYLCCRFTTIAKMNSLCAIILFCSFVQFGIGENILCFFNIPVYSHQLIFRTIWKELALRGHNVTVISPDILNDSRIENLKEIDIHHIYDIYKIFDSTKILRKNAFNIQKAFTFITATRMATEMAMKDENFQKIMKSDLKFDVVLAQAMNPLVFIVAAKFKAPIIGK